MKRAQYIFATGLFLVSTAAFAVTGPSLPESIFIDDSAVMSGEADIVNIPLSLYSAPDETMADSISGEIQINIPYNPLEAEIDIPTSWTPDGPKNINLNSATQVTSGPVLNMFIIFALSLIISGYVYKKSQFLSK